MTVIESPPPFVPQLLAVYNRRFHPLTIRTHVELMRKRGFVWWGRFRADAGRLSTAEARAEWPHIAALADDRLAAGEPTAPFVTNYEALHVCKVTHIVLGDDPESEVRREALPYYGDHSVPIWFRVEHVRALSYDMTTIYDWFNSRLGVVLSGSNRRRKAAGTFDPYATAENAYPIVLEAPTCAELFPPTQTSKRRWADQDDAMAPRPVHEARKELEKKLVTVWKRIAPESRELLANAWVQTKKLEAGEDDDPGMGFVRRSPCPTAHSHPGASRLHPWARRLRPWTRRPRCLESLQCRRTRTNRRRWQPRSRR